MNQINIGLNHFKSHHFGMCLVSRHSCPVYLFCVCPHVRDTFLQGHSISLASSSGMPTCIPGFILHTTPIECLSFQVRPHGSLPYCSDLLTDGGCVALLVVGFLLVTPLLVLALAAYCRLARHLQLGLCFIPYSRAVYKNLPATQHRGLAGGCCGQRSMKGAGKGKVWV